MKREENILFFNKLSTKEKFSYGLGDLASNLVFAALNSFIVIFWTDVAGIAAATTGMIILLSKVWDGINDPIMGYLVDRTKSRHGKARPWLIWASIPFAISAVLVFISPNFGDTGKIIYALITYILVTTLYTSVNIPYGVLAAKMTTDQNERGTLNVWRMTLAISGMLFVTSVFLPLATKIGNGNLKFGLPAAMAIFGVISITLFYIVFRNCKEVVGNSSLDKKDTVKFSVGVKSLFKNRAWMIELTTQMLGWIGTGGRMAVTAYYAIYVLNNPAAIPMLMTFPLIGTVIGMILFSTPLSKRFGKVKTSAFCTLFSGIISISIFFLPGASLSTILFLLILSGFISGPTMSLGFARLADTIEYGEYKTGVRVEGLTYAAGSMGGKLGSGFAGVVVGIVLSMTGYVPDAAQTDLAITGIKLLMFVIPGISGILSALLLLCSDLDKVYPDAIRALARKRAAEYGEN